MVSKEQKIRAILFYLSLFIFLAGLPFILSFALGYKFDTHTFKFTKTGLIVIKTQPQGAKVYLGKRLLNETTPLTINELLPGNYNLTLELGQHYPWSSEVRVEAGQVMRLEKIILFPLRPDIQQLNKSKISSFWVDKEKERIYYLNQEENIIYKSDLEGEHFAEIGSLPETLTPPTDWKISLDKEKLLCFNPHQIAVVYLEPRNKLPDMDQSFVFDYPNHRIIDVFWHSDSYHLILVTDTTIEVSEAKPGIPAVNLVNLNKRDISAFYDNGTDTLYFIDSQKATDGRFYDNVYKLELGTKLFHPRELIKPKPNE